MRRDLPAYVRWRRNLSADELLDLDMLDRGLAPQSTTDRRSADARLAVARRVIDAYRAATEAESAKDPLYRASNEWSGIFETPLKPLVSALKSGDARELRDLMDNFYRSSMSLGLCGLATDMTAEFFESRPPKYRRMQLLVDQVYRYRLLEEKLPNVKPIDLAVPNIGNPYGIYIDNKFVRNGVEYSFYYAERIGAELPESGARAVMELGGGIGMVGYFLHARASRPLSYSNFDLPEILAIASYQLLNLLPEASALLYGEWDDSDGQVPRLDEHDLVLMPSFLLEQVSNDTVDVSFNSYSLAEMDLATINNYVAQMSRITKGTILHVNHVRDSLVSADDFLFDAAKFDLVTRELAGWNGARNLRHDEYEFLYRTARANNERLRLHTGGPDS